MGRIFISYSHDEKNIVKPVYTCLKLNHIFTWFDENDIICGDLWERSIETTINSCDTFLIFYSRSYSAKTYCRREWKLITENTVAGKKIFVVALDDGYASLKSQDVEKYQFLCFYDPDKDRPDYIAALLKKQEKAYRYIVDEEQTNLTPFIAALAQIQQPKHHVILQALIKFALFLKEKEKEGKYVSPSANFGDLNARFKDGRFELVLSPGAFCGDNAGFADAYFKNVFFAAFKFSSGYKFLSAPPENLQFDGVFTESCHTYLMQTAKNVYGDPDPDKTVYKIFNRKIALLYKKPFDSPEFFTEMNDVLNASAYYESVGWGRKSQQFEYEITPLVIFTARVLYGIQNPLSGEVCAQCVPKLAEDGTGDIKRLNEVFENSADDVYVHANAGGGKTSLLTYLFRKYHYTLYINVADENFSAREGILEQIIESREAAGYKFASFENLCTYSRLEKRITLLIDGIDDLPADKRSNVLSELYNFKLSFRIIVATRKISLTSKLALTGDDGLNGFKRYALLRPDKTQVIRYVNLNLKREKRDDGGRVESEFAKLDDGDKLFRLFDNYTKINILLKSVSNYAAFSVDALKKEFSGRIKVYERIFESHGEFSMKSHIASYYRDGIVYILDIIYNILDREVDLMKELAYKSSDLEIPFEDAQKLRFREYYSSLSSVGNAFYFINKDVRNYFAASYINSAIRKKLPTAEELENLLAPVENNYDILEYLYEFDILEPFGDIELLLADISGHEKLLLILYKIIQYYDKKTQTEFLRNADIKEIPDKFLFRVENIERVVVPPSVKEIGRAAFANMPLLKEIDLAPLKPRGELTIRPWAILNCPALKKIRLGANYLKYRHPLFGQCPELEKIELDAANPALCTIADGKILASKDKKSLYCAANSLEGEITIPEGVEVICSNALSYLKKVTGMYLPSTLKEAETNFSDFCDRLERIDIAAGNQTYFSDKNGLAYTYKDGKKVLFRVPSGIEGELNLDGDINVIGSDSISCCTKIKKITVPRSVREIENYAFADTYSLENIIFEDIGAVEYFGNYIFLSTNPYLRIFGDSDYDIENFYAEYCKYKNDNKLKGVVRRKVSVELFKEQGLEIVREGQFKESYSAAVLVRNVTLFKDVKYREADFNILLIGLTEYNSILTKSAAEADGLVESLIKGNHISAVALSRDLPVVSQLNSKEYEYLTIVRCESGSTSTTKKIAAVIKKLGEEDGNN